MMDYPENLTLRHLQLTVAIECLSELYSRKRIVTGGLKWKVLAHFIFPYYSVGLILVLPFWIYALLFLLFLVGLYQYLILIGIGGYKQESKINYKSDSQIGGAI